MSGWRTLSSATRTAGCLSRVASWRKTGAPARSFGCGSTGIVPRRSVRTTFWWLSMRAPRLGAFSASAGRRRAMCWICMWSFGTTSAARSRFPGALCWGLAGTLGSRQGRQRSRRMRTACLRSSFLSRRRSGGGCWIIARRMWSARWRFCGRCCRCWICRGRFCGGATWRRRRVWSVWGFRWMRELWGRCGILGMGSSWS